MADLRSCCLAVLCLPPTILLAASGAGAQETAPAIQPRGAAHAPVVGQAAVAAPATVPAPAALPPPIVPFVALSAAPLQPVVSLVPPLVPPLVPLGTPAAIGGDRADAIARDIVLHPPQKQATTQDSVRLHTVNLKLGALLDRSVHGSEDSEVGRVIDVLVGDDGRPVALELDVGGFMGVGNRKIAVAWTLFDLSKPGSEPLRVALTETQVKSAPAAEDSGAITVVTGVGVGGASEPAPAPAKPKAAISPVQSGPAGPATARVPVATPPELPVLGLTLSPVLLPSVLVPWPAVPLSDAAMPDDGAAGDAAAGEGRALPGFAVHADAKRDLPSAAATASPVPRQAASSAGRH